MSKVGNLRAMFENKGETSPPERGRSPGLSGGTESPRPLSKIRTNFVAIEKDGRIGLQRDPSSDSVLSVTRKPISDTEGDAAAPQDPPPSLADKFQKSTRQGLHMETIPQSPQQDTSSTFQSLATVQAKGSTSAKARVPQSENADKTQLAEDKDPKAVRPEGASTGAKGGKPAQGENLNGKAAVERDKPKTGAGKDAAKAASSKPTPKVSAISTTKVATKPPTKSPTKSKTPTSPTKAAKLPSKTPEKKALHPDKAATPKAAATKTAGASAAVSTAGASGTKTPGSATKKPPTLQPSPAGSLDRGIGFVKPKPKSPTRPVALPPGLTTHTAASATKLNAQRPSLSRQSGSYLSLHSNQGRSPSRASVSTVGGPRTLRRQSSTINRPRPSLGPPPKLPAADHPITKREKEVDEGFLARMMRPTQASSSKTHEKVASPPRKVPGVAAAAKRPVTKEPIKKPVFKAEGSAIKKATPKAAEAAKPASRPVEKSTAPAAEKKAPGESVVLTVPNVQLEPEPTPEAKSEVREPAKSEPESVEPASVEDQPAGVQAEAPADEPVEEQPKEQVEEQPKEQVEESVQAAEPAEEKAVEPVDVTSPPPVEALTTDGSQEETASEAELVEPDTPVEAGDVQSKAADLLTNGAEGKIADEDKVVLEMEKREDDTTVAS